MILHGKAETCLNYCIWTSSVCYSLYCLHRVSNYSIFSDQDIYLYEDFTPGWFGRFQDISDYEWNCWSKLTIQLLPWFVINALGGELLRRQKLLRHYLPLWYCAVTLAAIAYIINAIASGLFLASTFIFFISALFRLPSWFVWIWAFLLRRYIPASYVTSTEEHIYLIELASPWLLLRCLAYSIEASQAQRTSLPIFLGYALYLPTFFLGPLLSFHAFLRQCLSPHRPWTVSRANKVIRSFIRCGIWYLVTIVALHFIYVNALVLRLYIVEIMTSWELAGFGIAMGHFFHLKYIVFYGIPCAWAALEGYETPRPPCCVSRVYLYSVMWRYFDHGLYLFLVRYIYVPVLKLISCRTLSRFVASVTCFLFIYVWHGEYDYILYWVVLNLAALSVEAWGKYFCSLPSVQQRLKSSISDANIRRLHCLSAAPLHYFSMISNYFFIGSLDIGKIYLSRVLSESMVNNLCILFVLYGAAQTALTIELKQKNKLS